MKSPRSATPPLRLDGWERERGANEYFFREFSEKKSYPLGIKIIFYSMTH